MSKVDSTDEQIVRLLGQDASQNSETLAKQLNLSSATVRRRLRKLISNGMLRTHGVVDAAQFGFSVKAVLILDVAPEQLEQAIDEIANMTEIRWASTTTGRSDIIAIAQFRTTGALSDFITGRLARIPGVKDTETIICLDVKKGRYAPLG